MKKHLIKIFLIAFCCVCQTYQTKKSDNISKVKKGLENLISVVEEEGNVYSASCTSLLDTLSVALTHSTTTTMELVNVKNHYDPLLLEATKQLKTIEEEIEELEADLDTQTLARDATAETYSLNNGKIEYDQSIISSLISMSNNFDILTSYESILQKVQLLNTQCEAKVELENILINQSELTLESFSKYLSDIENELNDEMIVLYQSEESSKKEFVEKEEDFLIKISGLSTQYNTLYSQKELYTTVIIETAALLEELQAQNDEILNLQESTLNICTAGSTTFMSVNALLDEDKKKLEELISS